MVTQTTTGGVGAWTRLGRMLRQRCPRCGRAPLFRTSLETHERCPACRLLIYKEEGYFLGAMYFSYALAVAFLGVLMLLWHLALPGLDLGYVALLAIASFVPFVPMTFRSSRVIWIYLDHWLWPDRGSPHKVDEV